MINRVVLIGRLTKDPDLRYTPTGTPVTNFTLAVNRNFKNQQGKTEADFINIVTWRGLAETVANYMKKGSLIAAEGRIQTRNYDNNEGKRVYITEIVADNVQFLDSKNSQSNFNNQNVASNNEPFVDDGNPIDISDDDLPF